MRTCLRHHGGRGNVCVLSTVLTFPAAPSWDHLVHPKQGKTQLKWFWRETFLQSLIHTLVQHKAFNWAFKVQVWISFWKSLLCFTSKAIINRIKVLREFLEKGIGKYTYKILLTISLKDQIWNLIWNYFVTGIFSDLAYWISVWNLNNLTDIIMYKFNGKFWFRFLKVLL